MTTRWSDLNTKNLAHGFRSADRAANLNALWLVLDERCRKTPGVFASLCHRFGVSPRAYFVCSQQVYSFQFSSPHETQSFAVITAVTSDAVIGQGRVSLAPHAYTVRPR